MPHSVFSHTGQRTRRGSNERRGPSFDARAAREFGFNNEDVFSVLRPIASAPRKLAGKGDNGPPIDRVTAAGKAGSEIPDSQVGLAVDDGDPWVDTDSVDGLESGTDLDCKL